MKLYIKQHIFSFTDRFTVLDASGQERFIVEGKLLSFGKQLFVYDMQGQHVASVIQKLFSFLPCYSIEIGGQPVCELAQELTLLKPSYRLKGSPFLLKGDFLAHEYDLLCEDYSIMHLSKEWMTWGDSYVLTIQHPPDELLALCCMLAVDCSTAKN